MKTKTVLILAMNFFSLSLLAQNTGQKIDKAIKDPKREKNAAKADVYIQKKVITSQQSYGDSTQLQNVIKPPELKKKKKKNCRKS